MNNAQLTKPAALLTFHDENGNECQATIVSLDSVPMLKLAFHERGGPASHRLLTASDLADLAAFLNATPGEDDAHLKKLAEAASVLNQSEHAT